MVLQVPLFKLQCGVNSYEWGKKGEESAAARFAATTPAEGFSIESEKPQPTAPLPPVASKYGSKLPFLFKVLSINKALSIQAHPNKKLAEQLHARDPKNYPDDNHKPEMAIAITPFEGLCGFRPLAEISHFLTTVPPLKSLVVENKADEFIATVKGEEESEDPETKDRNKKALQHAFASLLSATPEEIEKQTEELVFLAKSEGSNFAGGGTSTTSGDTLSELIIRLHSSFGADVGLFVLFFLNFVKMEPGEAMFLRADDIHAYLSGDIIECMAASDNVVRAGFTPKFKDKMSPSEYPYATLNRAAYSSGSAVILYDPPIEEFSVVRSLLKGHGSKVTFEPLEGPASSSARKGTIAVGPTVHRISEGNVFFVGSTAELVLQSEGEEDDEFVTFRAFCEVDEKAEGKL
ncbi:LOW QUALITY PROTEIN: mannose-6-phosphate isomerase [Colletotrichum tofieldiae]|nr:LOW QUALITY PROTEIN: mannose-6-phosphate isomerase [Colletotrichum tofieldiae]